MAINENLERFKGFPVVDWNSEQPRMDFAGTAVRVRVDYDEADEGITVSGKLAELLEAAGAAEIVSLVIGCWQSQDSGLDSSELIESLVSARDRLSKLRNLFIGDIMMEECEISWIRQSDLSPLLGAYERLEHLTVRGGENLSFGMLERFAGYCTQVFDIRYGLLEVWHGSLLPGSS